MAKDELKTWEKGGNRPGTERNRRLVAPDNRNNNKKKEGKKQAGMACAHLFITTAPSLSPSWTANANVGHLGKK